jgi:4-amino-4-deoxy-L-arabinose transferase-like glycosyltransferase
MKLSFNRTIDHWQKNKKDPPVLVWMSILWLLLIGWLAFFWNLGSTGLIDETEPLFAEAARQMTVTGDWITPFFDGETRFDKPALIYWLIALAYKILGVNSWAVRLPSAIAAMGLVSLGFYTLLLFGDSTSKSSVQSTRNWFCAALGSALMALNPLTIVWARTGVSDMLLTGCIGAALLSFFIGYAQPSKPAYPSAVVSSFLCLDCRSYLNKRPSRNCFAGASYWLVSALPR